MTNMISQFETSISAESRHFLTDVRHLPPCRRRFTLIEVLVVIGIAGLLLTLMGPAFNRMTRGNDVESHASGLKLGMERASSLAASSRRYVAVMLPYGISNESDPLYNYQRGGYRLAYVSQNGSGVYTLDSWLPGSEWENPRRNAGLYSISRATPASSITRPSSKVTEADMKEKKIKGDPDLLYDVNISGATCKAVIFSPFGDARTAAAEVELVFLIAGIDTSEADCLAIRLNTLSGKVEFIDL